LSGAGAPARLKDFFRRAGTPAPLRIEDGGRRRAMATDTHELVYEKRIYADQPWGWLDSDRHFRRDSDLFRTLRQLASDLDRLGVAYAVLGGMAIFAHGHRRLTNDLDVLVDPRGLEAIHRDLIGKGYRRLSEGSRKLRDTARGVKIRFQVSGEFPGGRGPKALTWPEPDEVAETIHGLCYVNLPTFVTMKIVEGVTDLGRLKDLADVVELIKTRKLPAEFVERLHPVVRDKYTELWTGVRDAPVPPWLETWPEDEEPFRDSRPPC
jgi:hypothetical protein